MSVAVKLPSKMRQQRLSNVSCSVMSPVSPAETLVLLSVAEPSTQQATSVCPSSGWQCVMMRCSAEKL